MKTTAQEIEIAVAEHFGYRYNIIVPNVSWGFGLNYEADMVVVLPSCYAMEIEIKVSASDIKADLSKKRQHESDLFKQLYFAVPLELANNENIPERAGILAVMDRETKSVKDVELKRAAKTNENAVKLSETQKELLREFEKIETPYNNPQKKTFFDKLKNLFLF